MLRARVFECSATGGSVEAVVALFINGLPYPGLLVLVSHAGSRVGLLVEPDRVVQLGDRSLAGILSDEVRRVPVPRLDLLVPGRLLSVVSCDYEDGRGCAVEVQSVAGRYLAGVIGPVWAPRFRLDRVSPLVN